MLQVNGANATMHVRQGEELVRQDQPTTGDTSVSANLLENRAAETGPRVSGPVMAGAALAASGLAYFVAGALAFVLFSARSMPSALWFGGGVLLAFLLLSPKRLWPWILAGTIGGSFLCNYLWGKPAAGAIALGFVDALEGWLAARILTWRFGPNIRFLRLSEIAGLMLFVAVGTNAFSALLGAASFATIMGAPFWPSWWTWWVSNGIGMLLATPCIVAWAAARKEWPERKYWKSRIVEAAFLLAGLSAVTVLVFGGVSAYSLVMPYVTFPFLIWAALRFGMVGASTAAVVMVTIAVWHTAHDQGPFLIAAGTATEKLLQVQAFITAALTCSLVPAAVIAERRATERTLRDSQASLDMAQQMAKIASFELDIANDLVHWSKEAFRIAHRDPALGEPTFKEYLANLHPDDRALLEDALRETMNGREQEVEYRLVSSSGKTTYIQSVARPFVDRSGKTVKILGVLMDVTEHRRIEDELRQAQKMEAVGRLAGGVAHDFNNLLGVMMGYSRLALADPRMSGSTRSRIEQISKAADRAASLTTQLLAFSRKQVLKPEVLDLNALVSEMEKMLRWVIGEQIELSTSLDPQLPFVEADPGQIDQVILNLALNAKDAMPGGGKLLINTSKVQVPAADQGRGAQVPPGDYVILKVTDTGRGMDEHALAHIFEPFFTTKEKGKGTGLGLATVYGIVRQSRGHIWVDSKVGVGTTFHICLPAASKGREPAETDKGAGVGASERSETVLLVEDEKPLRELIREVLSSMGCNVLESTSGEDAIRIAQQRGPDIDVVLTDVIMPKMNGVELSRQVRGLCPNARVLFMSGYSEEMIAQHDRGGQQLYFIQKPFNPEELRAKLQEITADRRAAHG